MLSSSSDLFKKFTHNFAYLVGWNCSALVVSLHADNRRMPEHPNTINDEGKENVDSPTRESSSRHESSKNNSRGNVKDEAKRVDGPPRTSSSSGGAASGTRRSPLQKAQQILGEPVANAENAEHLTKRAKRISFQNAMAIHDWVDEDEDNGTVSKTRRTRKRRRTHRKSSGDLSQSAVGNSSSVTKVPSTVDSNLSFAEVQHQLSDFVVSLDDIVNSKAAQKMWELNTVEQIKEAPLREAAYVANLDLDLKHEFDVDEDGLGGCFIRREELLKARQLPGRVLRSSYREEKQKDQELLSETAVSSPCSRSGRKSGSTSRLHKGTTRVPYRYSFRKQQKQDASPNSLPSSAVRVKKCDAEGDGISNRRSRSNSSLKRGTVSLSERARSLPASRARSTWESSDEEQDPDENMGWIAEDVYEVERILARRMENGAWLYYIKWTGWPYWRSTWQKRSTFETASEAAKEFFERERALSVVVRHQQQWLKQREISQLHSLIRWENEINNILRAEGQQILYIYNDVDYTRRRHNFTYITKNRFSAEVEVQVSTSTFESVTCNCETGKCGYGEKCCPAMEKSTFFYTKRGGLRPRFYNLSGGIVECYGCECSNDCPTKVIQNGRRFKVALVRTKKCGWGLFALEDIPSHTFVVEYVGEVLTITEGESRPDTSYQFEMDGFGELKYMLDAQHYGNEAAFINHSCNPNLIALSVRVERIDPSIHRIGLFSIRRIRRGEEFTLNYFEGKLAENKITSKEGTKKCYCGTENCMRYWPEQRNKDDGDGDSGGGNGNKKIESVESG